MTDWGILGAGPTLGADALYDIAAWPKVARYEVTERVPLDENKSSDEVFRLLARTCGRSACNGRAGGATAEEQLRGDVARPSCPVVRDSAGVA